MQPEKFLEEYGKKMIGLEFCYGVDNNQNPRSEWDQAKLRVLVVFFSPGVTRSVSNTYTALNSLIKEHYGEQVFVDYCYLPERDDIPLFKNTHTPTMFGNVSHRIWHEYDLVMMSLAILPELYNVPFVLKHNGVPLTFKERMERPDLPLFLFGGVCSPMMDILYGQVPDGGTCMVDLVYLGDAEVNLLNIIEEFINRSIDVSKQDFLLTLCQEYENLYVPAFYRVKWKLSEKTGYEIVSTHNIHDLQYPRIFARADDMSHAGFERKILNLSGDSVDSADIDISHGCSGSGCCSFCYEGTVSGPWRERDLEDIVSRMETVKEYAAPNSISFYSFNLNYYYRFVDLIYESARRFSQLSLINMRADVIGARPDYFEISKILGLGRASMAVEGMGERVRNGFLNKNLSLDQWKAAARAVFTSRVAEMKNGLIYTGIETQADYEESLSEFKQILELRQELGANTSVRVTITPLCYYPHTPIERHRRITSIQAIRGEKNLGFFLQGLKALGIRSKINARSRSTFMEQFLLDYGRAGTQTLCDIGFDEPPYYGYLSKACEENLMKSLHRHLGQQYIEPFLYEKPDKMLLWHHPVSCTDQKYLARFSANVKKLKPMRPCLVTPANVNPKCNQCGQCPDQESKDMMTKRVISSKANINDVRLALHESKERYAVMVCATLDPSSFYVSVKMLAHKIAAEICKISVEHRDKYVRVGKTNLYWVTSLGQRDFFSGRFYFPIYFSGRVDKIQLNQLQGKFHSVVVEKIEEIAVDANPIKLNDYNMFRVVSPTITRSVFTQQYRSFVGDVQVPVRSVGKDLDIGFRHFEFPHSVYVVDGSRSSSIYMTLPVQVNPHLYLATVMHQPYRKVLEETDVISLYHMVPTGEACSQCSKTSYKPFLMELKKPMCPSCLSKLLATKESRA